MYWQERVQKKRNRDKYPRPNLLACLVHSPRPINCANRDDKPEHHVKAIRMLAGRCNEQQYCAEHRQNYFQDSFTVHDRSPLTGISILASRSQEVYARAPLLNCLRRDGVRTILGIRDAEGKRLT